MINPTTTFDGDKYYFVKNGVIFDMSYNNSGDTCAILASDIKDDLPKIRVQSGGTTYTYYLDCYISRGDTYDSNSGFTKTIHGEVNNGEEPSLSFTDYFLSLCEEQIKDSVSNYTDKEYEDLKDRPDLLGIPKYILSGNSSDYSVSGENGTKIGIGFIKDDFTKYKKEGIAKKVIDQINILLNKYKCENITLNEFKTDAIKFKRRKE
jgi:hypothetical protein